MRQGRNVVLAAAAVSLLAGCIPLSQIYGPAPAPPIAVGPTTEQQIDGALQRYSARIGAMDAPGVAEMYTPDGVWERQSGTLYGRDAIRTAIASTGGVRVLSNAMTMINMSYNGPALIQVGEFKQSVRLANGKIVEVDGRFEATWIQGANGEWLVHRMVTRARK